MSGPRLSSAARPSNRHTQPEMAVRVDGRAPRSPTPAMERYSWRVVKQSRSRRALFNLFDARVKAVFRHLPMARDLMPYLDWPSGDEPDLSRIEALPQEWITAGRNLERRTADRVWLVRSWPCCWSASPGTTRA